MQNSRNGLSDGSGNDDDGGATAITPTRTRKRRRVILVFIDYCVIDKTIKS